MRIQRRFFPLAALTLLVCTHAAPAQVAYSTYGPGDSYSFSFISAAFAGYGRNAARFVPTETTEFNQVETSIARGGGAFPGAAVVLMVVPEVQAGTGIGFAPGVLPVWCATSTRDPLDQRAIYTFNGPRAALVGGQPYWLLLEASDPTNWYYSSPAAFGSTAFKNGSTWVVQPTSMLPAFRISNVNPAAPTGACCNPATAGCAVVPSTACTTLGLRFDGPGAACSPTPTISCTACPADFDHSGSLTVDDIFGLINAWFAGCP